MSKSSALPIVHWIAVVNGCLNQHGCLLHSPVETLKPLETLKINFVMADHVEQVQR